MEVRLRIVFGAFLGLCVACGGAQAAPTVNKAVIAERGAAPQIELVRQGCGPGWHRVGWRDRAGYWHWGRCAPY
jgi:hypothetical protein